MTTISIACLQLNSQTDIDANLSTIKIAIQEAAKMGAKLIVLPENACVMGRQQALAERFDEICQTYAQLAQTHQVHILAGTLPCQHRPNGQKVSNGKLRQVSLLFDDTGRQLARYDKIHLFRALVDDTVGRYDEGQVFEAGDQLVVAPCVINGIKVNIGMIICFDVRFSALAWQLRQLGADIITVPAAFTYKTGEAHWQTLLQARALDSQCMIVGATQGGSHQIGQSQRQTWGHAMIVNAHGQVLTNSQQSQLKDADFWIGLAEFDPQEQLKTRQSMPIFDCQRRDILI